MIRKCQILFCDNEHGIGDVSFPDIDGMQSYEVKQLFVNGNSTVRQLRKDAKQAGWGRVSGGDYCPACMESGI